MSLEIRTTWTQLGMRTTPPVLEIRQPRGELELKQQKTELVMEREPIRVSIDQSRCFYECGVKNTVEIVEDAAQLGREIAFEHTGQMAEEGDQLARIENTAKDIIGELALQRMERENDREWNIAFLPQSQPEFEVTGSLKLDWHVLKGLSQFTPRYPQINYQPGKLKIYIKQYGKIEIRSLDRRV
ncbi:MAG: DUF6470 family protein [Clostridia bacterium]|jgi:hypothetical protein|nr:DUF6470 family protein [Clostridia bacterium]